MARRNRPPDRLPLQIRDHVEVVRACREWNIGRLFRVVNNLSEEPAKFTVTHIGRLCGLSVSRVSEYMNDAHRVTAMGIVERISDGLRIPGERFGLVSRPWESGAEGTGHARNVPAVEEPSKSRQVVGTDVLPAGEDVRDVRDYEELARVFSLDQDRAARLRDLIERPRVPAANDEITIPARAVDGGIIFVRMSRRDFLEGAASLSAVSRIDERDRMAANVDVAQKFAASISAGDPEPLAQVQTTYDVDRAIAATVDFSTRKVLYRWAVDLDNPIARVNATGILAKIPGQGESDRVAAILRDDNEVRRLYLTAVTMRVCSVDWSQATKFVQNPTGFPFVSLVAKQFAREVVNPADTGARWCSARMLQDLSSAIGR